MSAANPFIDAGTGKVAADEPEAHRIALYGPYAGNPVNPFTVTDASGKLTGVPVTSPLAAVILRGEALTG